MYANEGLGKAFLFKVPAEAMADIIVRFGGYAHGSIEEYGLITSYSLKNNQYKYALRASPRGQGKQLEC
jgi:hypothetical protein